MIIPITDIKTPPNVPFRPSEKESNDFALMILKEPVQWSEKVGPICLPAPKQEFDGKLAIGAGWGRFAPNHENETQSTTLQVVPLKVSPKRYTAYKMFGTELKKNKHGIDQDVCSGDSGGPLMFGDTSSGTEKFVLIGTVNGAGYDCRKDVRHEIEGSDNGVWNKVSYHVDWIKQTAQELGETLCQ